MIQVNVKTNSTRRTVNADVTETPAQLFERIGANVSGATNNLNGTILSAADMQQPFSALGVQDGTSVSLNSVVKADGANK